MPKAEFIESNIVTFTVSGDLIRILEEENYSAPQKPLFGMVANVEPGGAAITYIVCFAVAIFKIGETRNPEFAFTWRDVYRFTEMKDEMPDEGFFRDLITNSYFKYEQTFNEKILEEGLEDLINISIEDYDIEGCIETMKEQYRSARN